MEDTGSLGLDLWFDDDDDDVCEDEEAQSTVQPATSSRQKREDLKDPDYQIPSRLKISLLHRKFGLFKNIDRSMWKPLWSAVIVWL